MQRIDYSDDSKDVSFVFLKNHFKVLQSVIHFFQSQFVSIFAINAQA